MRTKNPKKDGMLTKAIKINVSCYFRVAIPVTPVSPFPWNLSQSWSRYFGCLPGSVSSLFRKNNCHPSRFIGASFLPPLFAHPSRLNHLWVVGNRYLFARS